MLDTGDFGANSNAERDSKAHAEVDVDHGVLRRCLREDALSNDAVDDQLKYGDAEFAFVLDACHRKFLTYHENESA